MFDSYCAHIHNLEQQVQRLAHETASYKQHLKEHIIGELRQQLRDEFNVLLEEKLRKLLQEQVNKLPPVRIDNINYKIQELHVQELKGTLNIGMSQVTDPEQVHQWLTENEQLKPECTCTAEHEFEPESTHEAKHEYTYKDKRESIHTDKHKHASLHTDEANANTVQPALAMSPSTSALKVEK